MSQKTKKYLFLFIKIVVLLFSLYYIYLQWDKSQNDFNLPINDWTFLILFLLIFSSFNWFLEIKKWQFLVNKMAEISFYQALKQTLTSFSVSMLTPNRIGEYGLKIFFFQKSDFKKVLVLQSFQSFSQLFATLFFGFFGCLYFKYYGLALIILLIVLIFFNTKYFTFLPQKFQTLLSKIKHFSQVVLTKVLSLSVLRYITFSSQYLILLYWFGIENQMVEVYFTITLIYLFSSFLPTLQLFDVAIKGSVGVFVFNKIGVSAAIVLQTSFFMWFFNMLLPYFIGLFYWLKFKPTWQ